MDEKSQRQLNMILSWGLATGMLASSLSLAAKVFKENRDTLETKKLEKKLRNYTEPEEVVEVEPEEISAASDRLDPKKRERLLVKQASMPDSVANALSVVLAMAMAGGGAWGTSKLYNYIKRNELESEEEETRKRYLNKIYLSQKLEELEKEDKKPMFRYASEGIKKTAAGTGIDELLAGIMLLLGGSGLAAALYGRSYMAKKFPKLKHESLEEDFTADLSSADRIARKIKFVEKGKRDEGDSELGTFEKAASCFEPDLNAAVVKIAADMEQATGDFHGINDVVDCVALGQAENLKQCATLSDMMDYATEYMKSNVKVASETDKALARLYIGLDPIMSEIFVPNAIVEMQNRVPSIVKQASELTDTQATEALVSLLLTHSADMADAMQKCASEVLTDEEHKDCLDHADRLLEHDLLGEYLMREREW